MMDEYAPSEEVLKVAEEGIRGMLNHVGGEMVSPDVMISPEDGRDDYFGWRILQMRNVHALYPVDASPLSNAKAKLLVSATFPLPDSTEYFGSAVSWLWLSHISW